MIHPRVTLVTTEVVATMRGISREAAYSLADGGLGDECFMWVFNVATNPERERELRWWRRELETPLETRSLSLEEVIRQIVPRRDVLPGQYCGLRNWEVGELLRISRMALLTLREELQAEPRNGGIYVPRAALEKFLRTRWCYAKATQPLQPRLV
jgi:hypothetical protein